MLPADRSRFTVRVLRNGSPVPAGVGFVVADRYIVTCAHVINTALGREQRQQDRPAEDARVQVDFPILADADAAPPRTCRLESWSPPPSGGVSGGDVAGLLLVDDWELPPGVAPARLMDPTALQDAVVHVFGYPGDPPRRENGAWSRLRFAGVVGGGLMQLDADNLSAIRAQPGYSGSPVVVADVAGDAVLGMFGAASRDEDVKDSYAIPASRLVENWPGILDALTVPPRPYGGDNYGAAYRESSYAVPALRELPFAAPDFSGRVEEIGRIVGWLAPGPALRLVNIYGIPGSGKSALAIHVGHVLAPQYPDCQIHFNLRASDQQSVSVDNLLGGKLVELGVPRSEIPTGLELRSAAYRSALATRRAIVIVDNASAAAQVEPLLPGAEAAVIITSWALIPELPGVQPLPLRALSDDEAVAMLGAVSRRDIADADRATVQQIARLAGNLPLALRTAGGLMKGRPHWTWDDLLRRLSHRSDDARLKMLMAGSPTVQACFDLAYHELDTTTAQGYRLLGLAPSARISSELAQLLISPDLEVAEEVFDKLVVRELLQQETTSSFRMHDLLWLRARELVNSAEDKAVRQAAIDRMTAWSLGQLDTHYLAQLQAGLNIAPALTETGVLLAASNAYVDSPVVDHGIAGPTTTITEIFPAQRRVILMAPGGTGKTTMANHLCQVAATRRQAEGHGPVPLMVLIRDLRPGDERGGLEELIIRTLRYRYECELTTEALQVALQGGRIFLIADGLDEIIDPLLRQSILASISAFSKHYPQVPILVTTRPFSTVPDDLPGFLLVTIAPWTQDLATRYLANLAAANEGRMEHEDIEELREWVGTHPDREIINTPLGLQMLLSGFFYTRYLPSSFTALMEQILDRVATRERTRGLAPDNNTELRGALEQIAFVMQSRADNRVMITGRDIVIAIESGPPLDAPPEWIVDRLASRSGVLVETRMTSDGDPLFAFTHTAFREHLAASRLARMPPREIVRVMAQHFSDASWEAVFVTALELGRGWYGEMFINSVRDGVADFGDHRLSHALQAWIEQVSSHR